jgi:hypothetical protein
MQRSRAAVVDNNTDAQELPLFHFLSKCRDRVSDGQELLVCWANHEEFLYESVSLPRQSGCVIAVSRRQAYIISECVVSPFRFVRYQSWADLFNECQGLTVFQPVLPRLTVMGFVHSFARYLSGPDDQLDLAQQLKVSVADTDCELPVLVSMPTGQGDRTVRIDQAGQISGLARQYRINASVTRRDANETAFFAVIKHLKLAGKLRFAVRTPRGSRTRSVREPGMVEAAGQCIHIFRCGLDYAFIRHIRPDAERVIRRL